jgi:phosphoribosylglycinamide formyltransferase-1
MTTDQNQRKSRLTQICCAFPEVEMSGEQHLSFSVRKKAFAYYLDNHHDDGKIALACKATFEDQDFLLHLDAGRFYKPAYLGANGWIAVRLDAPDVDWSEIYDLAERAYRLVAPKRLVAMLEPAG